MVVELPLDEKLRKLIEKHDNSETRLARAKLALLIYNYSGLTTYLPDHGPHMEKLCNILS